MVTTMRDRFREWVCGLAWRVLWRWWPDRHFLAPVRGIANALGPDLYMQETARRETAAEWAAQGRRVRERLDHAGRRVDPPVDVEDGNGE
jgi:hypothetical protein